MPIRIEDNESAMRMLHKVKSNLRELTYNLYSLPGNTNAIQQNENFADVLSRRIKDKRVEPSAWHSGYSLERGVSYTASRVIDEQLQAMTEVKIAALRAGYSYNTGAVNKIPVIGDVDVANEMVKVVGRNMLSQSGQSILAQANQDSGMVLSLLA